MTWAFAQGLALAAAAAANAPAAVADTTVCKPVPAEFILTTASVRPSDDLLYRNTLRASPMHGRNPVVLCAGQRYRVVPVIPLPPQRKLAERCMIDIPATGTTNEIIASIAKRMKALPSLCRAPVITLMSLYTGEAGNRNIIDVRPSGRVSVQRKRQIMLIAEPDPAPTTPDCRVEGVVPPEDRSLANLLTLFATIPLPPGCPPISPIVRQGSQMADIPIGGRAVTAVEDAWPPLGQPFDTRHVRPVLFIAEAKIVTQSASAPPVPSSMPAALVAGAGVGAGAVGINVIRRLTRRQRSDTPAAGVNLPNQPLNSDLKRLRPLPDYPHGETDPAQGWASAMSLTLADVLGCAAIGAGQMLIAMDIACQNIMSWSRSDVPGALPPKRLANAICAVLPEALQVSLAEIMADITWPDASKSVTVATQSAIQILSLRGVPIPGLLVEFNVELCVTRQTEKRYTLTIDASIVPRSGNQGSTAVWLHTGYKAFP